MVEQRSATSGSVHGKGPLFVLSGPSGSGKSTLLARLVADSELPLHLAVSATTRPPRAGEQNGKHYYFWTKEEFLHEKDAGAFLEWAEVHGHCYGTLRREVDAYRVRGIGVILDIDVQGAATIRRVYPEAVLIFVRTDSLQTYEKRLRRRGTETEEAIRKRLAAAERELRCASQYDYEIVNEDLAATVARLKAIITGKFPGGDHAG
jgi:guanylate kinase